MRAVVVVDGGDERELVLQSFEFFLKERHGLLGDLPQIQVFEGILKLRIRADHQPVKVCTVFCFLNHTVYLFFCERAVLVEERTGDLLAVPPPPLPDVAHGRFDVLLAPGVGGGLEDCHYASGPCSSLVSVHPALDRLDDLGELRGFAGDVGFGPPDALIENLVAPLRGEPRLSGEDVFGEDPRLRGVEGDAGEQPGQKGLEPAHFLADLLLDRRPQHHGVLLPEGMGEAHLNQRPDGFGFGPAVLLRHPADLGFYRPGHPPCYFVGLAAGGAFLCSGGFCVRLVRARDYAASRRLARGRARALRRALILPYIIARWWLLWRVSAVGKDVPVELSFYGVRHRQVSILSRFYTSTSVLFQQEGMLLIATMGCFAPFFKHDEANLYNRLSPIPSFFLT
jgi:hypothetical protein